MINRPLGKEIREIAQHLGWVIQPKFKEYDLSIYGAGPAGLSAAVYAASEGLRTVLLERHAAGGQAGSSSLIKNYLGFPAGISGADLAEKARQQAVKFGIELLILVEAFRRAGIPHQNLGVVASYAPMYAGYVAYRGLVDEGELDRETAAIMTERFVFYQFRNSHILQYVIPGENESLVPGERRFNWVWYVNYDENTELPNVLTDKNGKRHDYSIPPGMMANDIENEMRQYADRVLVPPFQKLIAATKEPFVQAILDLGVPNMAFERVALVGDAAFIPRPHTAASVSKAAANAIALADALVEHDHNILDALKAWEGEQLTLGMNLWKRGRDLGETSQFVYGKNRWEK